MQKCNNNLSALGLEACEDGLRCTQDLRRSGKVFERETRTEFKPNPENAEYKKKYLGVKKKSFKKKR